MAAPHVAGAAAVLIGARPGLTPAQVRQALLDGSDGVAALDRVSVSDGRIDLAQSLEAVGVATPPAATPAPVPAPAPAPAPAPPAETAPPAQTAPPAELTPPVTRTPRARTRASRPRIRTIARRGGRRPVVRIRVATTVGVRHRVRVGRTTTRWTTGAVLSTQPLRAGRTHVIRVQSRDRTGRIATSTPLRITVSRTGATRLVSGGTRLPVRRGARRVRE